MYIYEEEETVTTDMNIVGVLTRKTQGIQSYVIDPVDGEKIYLNSNDDMYEDADGKIWRLK